VKNEQRPFPSPAEFGIESSRPGFERWWPTVLDVSLPDPSSRVEDPADVDPDLADAVTTWQRAAADVGPRIAAFLREGPANRQAFEQDPIGCLSRLPGVPPDVVEAARRLDRAASRRRAPRQP